MFRSFFLSLSTNRSLRSVMETSSVGKALSRRFVAGMSLAEALNVTEKLNLKGLAVTLDALGEDVNGPEKAHATGTLYQQMLDAIAVRNLNANVSLKLTQMGIELSHDLAEEVVAGVVSKAAGYGNFVRIDMEGTPLTIATIAMTRRLHGSYPGAVGTVLQAYLFRTEEDAKLLLGEGIRIRLCKGAYKEDGTHAFQAKADVDANYVKLMQLMTPSGVYCGMATHDEAMVAATQRWVAEQGIARDQFEFQMLYGIRRDLQQELVDAGYRVRVYVPFGPEWYPYFMRRLAERPANAIFLLKNLVRS